MFVVSVLLSSLAAVVAIVSGFPTGVNVDVDSKYFKLHLLPLCFIIVPLRLIAG